MNLGLENKKKTAFLGALTLLLVYTVYTNLLSGPSIPSSGSPSPNSATEIERAAGTPRPGAGAPARATAPKARNEEFHPVLRSKRQEQQVDPAVVDPTLHLELLAKLQEVKPENSGRNLFQFGAPPPPKPAETAKLRGPEPIELPKSSTPAPNVQAPPPPPPPPFKYYGLSVVRTSGRRTAFFLDGDEIVTAPEGGLLKKRYRVVRIGPDSVTLEDIQLNRQQPLRISEDVNAPA
jgi:hypothetical protein